MTDEGKRRRRRAGIVGLMMLAVLGLLLTGHHLLIVGATGEGGFADFARSACTFCHGSQ